MLSNRNVGLNCVRKSRTVCVPGKACKCQMFIPAQSRNAGYLGRDPLVHMGGRHVGMCWDYGQSDWHTANPSLVFNKNFPSLATLFSIQVSCLLHSYSISNRTGGFHMLRALLYSGRYNHTTGTSALKLSFLQKRLGSLQRRDRKG